MKRDALSNPTHLATARSRALAGVLPWIRKAVSSARLPPDLEDEAIQQALIELAPYVDRFSALDPKERAAYVWVASSRVATRVARQWREARVSVLAAEGPASLGQSPEAVLEAKERAARAALAFDGLATSDRTTAAMVLGEGLPEAEVAAKLGTPRGTVASRVRRARDVLRRALTITTSWKTGTDRKGP